MEYLFGMLLIMAGLLGASALIVAKKPDAAQIIEKLTPFQALIGAGTLVLALIEFVRIGPKALIELMRVWPFFGATWFGAIISGAILGFMFAVPLMGRLGAGQQKAAELSAKLAPWQLLIGLVAIVAGLMVILFQTGIIKPSFMSNM